MGQKVGIFALKKWQLSLTLGFGGAQDGIGVPRYHVADIEKPVAKVEPGLRIIGADRAAQSDVAGDQIDVTI